MEEWTLGPGCLPYNSWSEALHIVGNICYGGSRMSKEIFQKKSSHNVPNSDSTLLFG